MYKLVLLFALVALAAAAPGLLGGVVSPLGYSLAAPAAVVAPAPYAYASGVRVAYSVEPVEQHGYRIVY